MEPRSLSVLGRIVCRRTTYLSLRRVYQCSVISDGMSTKWWAVWRDVCRSTRRLHGAGQSYTTSPVRRPAKAGVRLLFYNRPRISMNNTPRPLHTAPKDVRWIIYLILWASALVPLIICHRFFPPRIIGDNSNELHTNRRSHCRFH